MKDVEGLDLSGLAQFRPSDFLAPGADASEPVAAVHVDLLLVDFDPGQPRRSVRQESIDLLTQSIREHGVLEPVSLRRHPEHAHRFIVNRGERRVRAARIAGLASVPAFVDERIDRFAQAVENLHREDMSVFDLAAFIEQREKEGHSRQEIARRLAKSPSFVTEAAALIGAPAALRAAVESGRVGGDLRTLYRLVTIGRESPEVLQRIVSSGEAVTRASVDALAAEARASRIAGEPIVKAGSVSGGSQALPSRGRTVLIVEHQGRRGSLRIKATADDAGEVRFGDGTRTTVPLASLRLVCWASEDDR